MPPPPPLPAAAPQSFSSLDHHASGALHSPPGWSQDNNEEFTESETVHKRACPSIPTSLFPKEIPLVLRGMAVSGAEMPQFHPRGLNVFMRKARSASLVEHSTTVVAHSIKESVTPLLCVCAGA